MMRLIYRLTPIFGLFSLLFVSSCEKEVELPVLTTASVTEITQTTAKGGGNVTSDGGGTLTGRGIVWSTSAAPEITLPSKTSDGTTTGSFQSELISLTANTTYFVRAYATNSAGTAYGSEVSFKTLANLPPTVTVSAATAITANGATVSGTVTSGGTATVTSRGIAYGTTTGPSIAGTRTSNGSGEGSFSGVITGLAANTKYFARAYAVNSVGTSYSEQIEFTTPVGIPTITSNDITRITNNSATGGGNITSANGATITAKGIVWSTSPSPTVSLITKTQDGSGTGTYISSMISLAPNTKYYVRAYATNSVGTAYGVEKSFTSSEEIRDGSGNTYGTVKIGTQTWMRSNLRTTTYNNGNPINLITINSSWGTVTFPAYCDFNNDAANAVIFGKLYNYYVVSSSQNVCPQGYHVPTQTEWKALATIANGDGDKLKRSGQGAWSPMDTGTNDFGFDAVGSSYRVGSLPATEALGAFGTLRLGGYQWAETINTTNNEPYYFGLANNTDGINTNGTLGMRWGLAIRCLKD